MKSTKLVPALIFGGIASIAIGSFVPGAALANDVNAGSAAETTNPAVAQLLNRANVINYEEIQTADMTKNKAGDNQALMTFATTLKEDHQANENAVTALSRQANVKIQPTPASVSQKLDQLKNLKGGEFDAAMLNDEVKGHERALSFFEAEKAKFHGDPNVELYVNETIPVLRAHLEMARTLRQHMGQSNENPANNKSASR